MPHSGEKVFINISVYLVNGELAGLSIEPSYFNKKLTLFWIIIQTCEKQKQIYG